MKLRRFMLFTGDHYYPCGGMADFVASYRTITEAKAAVSVETNKPDWAHIYDINKGEIITRGQYSPDEEIFHWKDIEKKRRGFFKYKKL